MTPQQKTSLTLLALILPFLLVGFIFMQGIRSFDGTEYRVRITGYDPRDILRGHYLMFRYEWPTTSQCKPNEKCVACFSGNPKHPTILLQSFPNDDAPTKCEAYWSLQSVMSVKDIPQPNADSLRFYIPEIEAPTIERLLRTNQDTFEIGVIPHQNGTVTVKNLYINGELLSDYLND